MAVDLTIAQQFEHLKSKN